MIPTSAYYTFHLAKERGFTVGQMLIGHPLPFAAMEQYLWLRFDRAYARLDQQANPKSKRR